MSKQNVILRAYIIHGLENVNSSQRKTEHRVGHSQIEMTNGQLKQLAEVDLRHRCDTNADRNIFIKFVEKAQENFGQQWGRLKDQIKRCVVVIFVLAYFAYFTYAMYVERLRTEESARLLWMTSLAVGFFVYKYIDRKYGAYISDKMAPIYMSCRGQGNYISIITVGVVLVAVIIFVFVDALVITNEPYNLVSLFGTAAYLLFLFVFSYSPAKVNWRAVAWGIALQLVFGLIIMRWSVGFQVFNWIGHRVSIFLSYTNAGSKFVFGPDTYTMHYFAFAILPVVIFFSAVISGLYYLGVMQVVIEIIGNFLENVMGTTSGESMNAAANIFLGQSEAPLIIRPLLKDMTKSELHAVVTGGFATVAGSVLAAYISFGVPANHLVSASVMSAPAALAVSKLFYPETEESKTKAEEVKKMENPDDYNLIDSLFSGAAKSIALVANIAVNLIAALALLEFVNSTLTWFGHRAGLYEPQLTLQLICSYLWYPLPFLMGVYPADCRKVAELIAVKTFLNEFVAYRELSVYIKNKEQLYNHTLFNGSYVFHGDDIILHDILYGNETTILEGGILYDRSEVIATYALCGFSNIGSMGIMLGALSAMAPERKSDIAKVILRSLTAGSVACFLTACIAGLFFQPF